MHVLITGGTGLIGRALCERLTVEKHRVSVLSRTPDRVQSLCGSSVSGVAELHELDHTHVDAVINLAGAPIANRLWTAKRKAELWASRVSLTEQLVDWMGRLASKPSVLISGSAVGWYGDGADNILTEADSARPGYTNTLCDAWESAAKRAASYGIRVCLVRTGLVVAPGAGFLQRMILPFKFGLGGPIGPGSQYMPWVHIDDEVGIIMHLLNHPQCKGPFNATAPNPVTNREFARSLGKALNRPAVIPVPGLILRAGLGEMAGLLLTGQRAMPAQALASGYRFHFEHLDVALEDVLGNH
ncbi:MAG TPA: TIGR01777 family protein [Pseudomonas xinjiangensis]|uniref:TIGR01777 family protein n=2 Tax=root TaxID=1 RepID=A0A7V1BNS7_9GAMM|nr:TIGR01777 family protein [Halopseudomonas xinjiangensis]HEC49233.1 TIGR01777 family protein [Halopseudomonas xinjiangensis]